MNENKTSVDCFFEQLGSSCGVCATNVLLKMWGLPGVIFSFHPIKGVSPKKILWILRRQGLDAKSKRISIRNLKPRSLLYYPFPNDHYVVVKKIADGKALVYDSEKKGPYWLYLSVLKKKWYGQKSDGWVIETRKGNSKK